MIIPEVNIGYYSLDLYPNINLKTNHRDYSWPWWDSLSVWKKLWAIINLKNNENSSHTSHMWVGSILLTPYHQHLRYWNRVDAPSACRSLPEDPLRSRYINFLEKEIELSIGWSIISNIILSENNLLDYSQKNGFKINNEDYSCDLSWTLCSRIKHKIMLRLWLVEHFLLTNQK